jgi:hypothetical protein
VLSVPVPWSLAVGRNDPGTSAPHTGRPPSERQVHSLLADYLCETKRIFSRNQFTAARLLMTVANKLGNVSTAHQFLHTFSVSATRFSDPNATV